jgi:hypothetical protein
MRQGVENFLNKYQDIITGTISTFDRLIFKGHLSTFFPHGAFARFLSRQGVLLKNFAAYVETATQAVKAQAQQIADKTGRPFLYLESASTFVSGSSKEDRARTIAARDGITEGLICIFYVLESCTSFVVRGNRDTHRLEVVRKRRKCLHYYFYYVDLEFGFMHVRLQSWFPFSIQVYINGREWLARQLDQRGIAYQRYDNKITQVADLSAAKALCKKFAHRQWPRVFNALARRINPHLNTIARAGFGGYYWVADQAEYATDVMFRDRASLQALFPSLVELSMTTFSAEDVLRFLGRKLHGNFKGEVTTDLKRRPEGRRVKHKAQRNAIKMYDCLNVLRVETTINNPREFRVLRVSNSREGRQRRWMPMGKGVANFWRYRQVGLQSNQRYLDALAHAQLKGKAIAQLDRLCRPRTNNGKRYARFNPVTAEDCTLFTAVMAGEHALNGFRNKAMQARLYSRSATSETEQRQRSARVSRWLAKLRGHGLIAKVKNSRLYRVTKRGYRLMAAAIHCRNHEFPDFVLQAA